MLSWLLGRAPNRTIIERLHAEIVAAARDPAFFTTYGIADSFEGRFEVVTLHAWLALRRLSALPPPAPEIAQDLTDLLFRHFDLALRELGVGDTSVPKHMRRLAEAFLGRCAAYDAALKAGRTTLDHDDPGSNPSKVMNVIYPSSPERDAGGKPVPAFLRPALAAALARNVYVGAGDPGLLAAFVEAADAALARTPLEAFVIGPLRFPDPASIEEPRDVDVAGRAKLS